MLFMLVSVGNDVQARDSFVVVGLWPGMSYVVKVRATNSAGSTVAEYPVTTLNVAGGTFLESTFPLSRDIVNGCCVYKFGS